MAMRLPLPNRLLRDDRGATILEFALVSPILCTLLLGSLDYAHTLYLQSVLQGTLQKAGRDSTLENADSAQQDVIDAKVKAQVLLLNKSADVAVSRRFYRTFSKAAAAQAETFTDSANGIYKNGKCDNGEAYIDANNNGVWDKDGADAGQGGARDVVVYKVTVSYPRMFPIDKFIGGNGTTVVTASTVLTNQPFGDQGTYDAATQRNCPAAT